MDAYLHDVDMETWLEVVEALAGEDGFYICSRPDVEDKYHSHGENEEWIAPLLVIE